MKYTVNESCFCSWCRGPGPGCAVRSRFCLRVRVRVRVRSSVCVYASAKLQNNRQAEGRETDIIIIELHELAHGSIVGWLVGIARRAKK